MYFVLCHVYVYWKCLLLTYHRWHLIYTFWKKTHLNSIEKHYSYFRQRSNIKKSWMFLTCMILVTCNVFISGYLKKIQLEPVSLYGCWQNVLKVISKLFVNREIIRTSNWLKSISLHLNFSPNVALVNCWLNSFILLQKMIILQLLPRHHLCLQRLPPFLRLQWRKHPRVRLQLHLLSQHPKSRRVIFNQAVTHPP